jgi:maltose alpha-D-glucosyltransferase/alpha-amylase
VAELHLALGAPTTDAAFVPEPYSMLDRRSKYQSVRTLAARVLRLLRERLVVLSARTRQEAERVLASEAALLRSFEPLLRAKMAALRIRVHGRLHLGHVLQKGADFVFTDVGGPRDVTLSERRRKRSPLRDLASMVRSFDFAALTVLFDPACVRESDAETARPWAFHWASWTSAAFLQAYLEAIGGALFVPTDPRERSVLFDVFWVERALHQLKTQLKDGSNDANIMVALLGIANLFR